MITETISIHTFKEGELFDERYRLLKRAGSGGFADVWKAEDTMRSNKVVALKIYSRLDDDGIKDLAKEFDETEDIRHANLLTSNHFATVGNIPYLVMHYCDGGNLSRRAGRMGSDEMRLLLRDICGGLAYLHAEGIVHQDIKPENILYDSKHGRYLLTDFGISSKTRTRLSKSVNMANAMVSMTTAYAPPEKFSTNPADRLPDAKGDIFSLGVTLYELATGILPVDLPQSIGQLMLISQGEQPLYFDNISDEWLRGIIMRCMDYRKDRRPTAEEIIKMLDRGSQANQATGKLSSGERPPTVKVNIPSDDKPKQEVKQPTTKVNDANPRETKEEDPKKPDPVPKGKKWLLVAVALVAVVVAIVLWPIGKPSDVSLDGNTLLFTVDGQEFNYNMVYVEGGTFTMGCTSEQGGDCFYDEEPSHSVTLSNYYIGETEVTQALWKAVMGSNPSQWTSDNLPVEQVSYTDVETFITKLNRKTGRTFRMPTEAEWEYAARGGKKSRGYKYSGSNNIGDVAWYEGNSGRKTHPVRQKQPNELGIYDMLGNVREWCNDWYGSYSSGSQTNPKGPSSGSYRVIRGGSWSSYAGGCRVSYRYNDNPSYRNFSIGFRLALVP